MLIGFRNRPKRDEILASAPGLVDTDHTDIHVVPDLTAKQRQDDADVRAECERLNKDMTEEDFLVWEWRPVGQKGLTTKARLRKRPANGKGKRMRADSPQATHPHNKKKKNTTPPSEYFI